MNSSERTDGSVPKAQLEMDAAVEEWLKAQQAYENYLAATERLFEVFARSWQGSRPHVAKAFADFRQALLREHGYSPSRIAAVLPQQTPDKE